MSKIYIYIYIWINKVHRAKPRALKNVEQKVTLSVLLLQQKPTYGELADYPLGGQ